MGNGYQNLTGLVAPVVLSFLTACTEPAEPIRISFAAYFDGVRVQCSASDDSNSPQITDLRFFVHDVQVADVQGNWQPIDLDTESPWQTDRIALLDLENGEGACRGGSSFVRGFVDGKTSAATIAAVRFTLGVPFDLNHSDPVKAPSPLNQSVMHWHWQGGYKFLRAGLATASGSSWFHLGSTECHGTIGAIERCNHPNRVTVEISAFDPATDSVAVQLDRLFANVALGQDAPSRCMSSLSDAACQEFLANLGLPASDTSADKKLSTVFTHASDL